MNSYRLSQKDDYRFNVLAFKNMKENIYIGSPVRKRELPPIEGGKKDKNYPSVHWDLTQSVLSFNKLLNYSYNIYCK